MARKRSRRPFGSVRQERSGRWSARVPIPNSGGQHRSLGTFPTKRAAEDALAVERAAIVGGTFIDPDRGRVTLSEYAARFVATGAFRDRTRALYERLLTEWIEPRHYAQVGERSHPIELGSRPMSSITGDDIDLWFTAVRAESRRRAVARHEKATLAPRRVNAAIREWANESGRPVAETGRIPVALRAAWEAAGRLARMFHGSAALGCDGGGVVVGV